MIQTYKVLFICVGIFPGHMDHGFCLQKYLEVGLVLSNNQVLCQKGLLYVFDMFIN